MPSPTSSQRWAIDHDDGRLIILLCMGSAIKNSHAGLVARMAKKVENGANRASMVAFRFTDHLADGLKSRIRLTRPWCAASCTGEARLSHSYRGRPASATAGSRFRFGDGPPRMRK